MTKRPKKSILWELSIPGRSESSYLFGTIHLPEHSLFFRIEEAREKLQKCTHFMAEYPLDDPGGDPTAFQLPEGNLQQYFSEKHWSKLCRQMEKSFGIHLGQFSYLKPIILEQVIAETLVEDHKGSPMDVQLWNFAKAEGLDLHGAESLESQMEILRQFTLDLQIKHLKNIGKNPEKYRKQVKQLTKYYLEQDLRSLYHHSIKSLAKMKAMLVYDRNHKIVASMLPLMESGTLFCAVGAGHFYGEQGILRLLKANGIRVKAL
jgi:uncharacterized protein YbaP (TraB family)